MNISDKITYSAGAVGLTVASAVWGYATKNFGNQLIVPQAVAVGVTTATVATACLLALRTFQNSPIPSSQSSLAGKVIDGMGALLLAGNEYMIIGPLAKMNYDKHQVCPPGLFSKMSCTSVDNTSAILSSGAWALLFGTAASLLAYKILQTPSQSQPKPSGKSPSPPRHWSLSIPDYVGVKLGIR